MNLVDLDKPITTPREYSPITTPEWYRNQPEVVGDKTMAALESDFLSGFNKSRPNGRPKGGLTISEMAIAAKVGHASIWRWLAKQMGYKAVLGTKQYATRKQVVTYYVKK